MWQLDALRLVCVYLAQFLAHYADLIFVDQHAYVNGIVAVFTSRTGTHFLPRVRHDEQMAMLHLIMDTVTAEVCCVLSGVDVACAPSVMLCIAGT